MSARVEAVLARLHVDAAWRATFLRDPDAALADLELTDQERAALRAIDRRGLALAAASLAAKHGQRRRRRWWDPRTWR